MYLSLFIPQKSLQSFFGASHIPMDGLAFQRPVLLRSQKPSAQLQLP
jgi:hypothetical protein